jgi:hypothetical protein
MMYVVNLQTFPGIQPFAPRRELQVERLRLHASLRMPYGLVQIPPWSAAGCSGILHVSPGLHGRPASPPHVAPSLMPPIVSLLPVDTSSGVVVGFDSWWQPMTRTPARRANKRIDPSYQPPSPSQFEPVIRIATKRIATGSAIRGHDLRRAPTSP